MFIEQYVTKFKKTFWFRFWSHPSKAVPGKANMHLKYTPSSS